MTLALCPAAPDDLSERELNELLYPDLYAGEEVAPEHDVDLASLIEVDTINDVVSMLQSPFALGADPAVTHAFTAAVRATASSYFLAPCLATLRAEVDAAFPNRDKASDGWIGDTSHAARPSDHNPDWLDPEPWRGIVRALDLDIDDGDSGRDLRRELLNALIGDDRVYYIISNGIIYSATYGFVARRYTGSNGHYAHVHVSVRSRHQEFSTAPWLRPATPPFRVKRLAVDLSNLREAFDLALAGKTPKPNNGVGRVQRSLNSKLGLTLAVDGVVGPSTLAAWGRWERSMKGGPVWAPRRPDMKSLIALSAGRFRVQV